MGEEGPAGGGETAVDLRVTAVPEALGDVGTDFKAMAVVGVERGLTGAGDSRNI